MTVAVPPADNISRTLTRFAAPAPLEAKPDDFDISSIFRLLRRRIVLICGITFVLTAAITPAILGMKPVYYAESRIMIRNSFGALLDTAERDRDRPPDLASESERLLSRSISERVVNELKLADRKEFNPALQPPSLIGTAKEQLRNLIFVQNGQGPPVDGMERIIQSYYRALTVRRDPSSGVMQIGFTSEDPVLAAAVANGLIAIYLDERRQSDVGRIGAAEELLQKRIAAQRDRLEAARAAVSAYRDQAGPISSAAQAEQARALAALNDQLARLQQTKRSTAAAIVTLGSPNRDLTSPQLPLPDRIAVLQAEVRLQQRQLDQLLQTYGDKAEEVIAQRAAIAAMTSTLGHEVDAYMQSQQAALAAVDRDIAKLQDSIALAEQRLTLAADRQADLATLIAASERERAAMDRLESQRRSLADQATVPTTEVELLSPAAIPLQPQGRSRSLYLIGALLGALSIAVTIAILREMMDTTVHSHEDLHAIGGLVPAGHIPLATAPRRATWPAHMRRDQGGLFGESIRATIVALRQSNGGRLPNSIVITSAVDGEGKSFIALSLAMELVAARQPVLLVESDLVRGNLGAFFNAEDTVGLGEYLNGEVELSGIVHHHARTGIDYILRGSASPYLRSYLPDLTELKKLAQSHGQCLLIDSAPLLASTDTVHLAVQAERTLLVVQWAKTRLRAVEFAVQRLREASQGAIMVAINKVNTKKHRRYGYKDAEMYVKSLEKYYL